MALDACRIKRCDYLYSGDENSIRSAASLAICKVLEQNAHLCGLSENSLFCFYGFRRRFVDAINIEYCFPMPSEDRNDHDQIEHMLKLILAIDV